jgi:hypothetical protein
MRLIVDRERGRAGPGRRTAAAIEVECCAPVPGWKLGFETAPVARLTGAAVQEHDGFSLTGFGNVRGDAVDCHGKHSRLRSLDGARIDGATTTD